jgi:hypothetical protein
MEGDGWRAVVSRVDEAWNLAVVSVDGGPDFEGKIGRGGTWASVDDVAVWAYAVVFATRSIHPADVAAIQRARSESLARPDNVAAFVPKRGA